MAPEQARGEAVDARADVCSMGLVLYFLLTGRSLYRGENAYSVLVQAAQGLTQACIQPGGIVTGIVTPASPRSRNHATPSSTSPTWRSYSPGGS